MMIDKKKIIKDLQQMNETLEDLFDQCIQNAFNIGQNIKKEKKLPVTRDSTNASYSVYVVIPSLQKKLILLTTLTESTIRDIDALSETNLTSQLSKIDEQYLEIQNSSNDINDKINKLKNRNFYNTESFKSMKRPSEAVERNPYEQLTDSKIEEEKSKKSKQ